MTLCSMRCTSCEKVSKKTGKGLTASQSRYADSDQDPGNVPNRTATHGLAITERDDRARWKNANCRCGSYRFNEDPIPAS